MERINNKLILFLILAVLLYITTMIIKPINILVLGIDQPGTLGNPTGEIGDNGQADFVAVVHVDFLRGDFRVITIPRETTVKLDLDMLDDTEKDKEINQLLCMQFAYASTSREGAELVQKCLEENFGVKTDYFIACSMGGIPSIIDAFGGVDIITSQDYEYASETIDDWVFLPKGINVHLNGAEAYDFVHFRDIENYGTNQDRMDRQKEFLSAFKEKSSLLTVLKPQSLASLSIIYKEYIKTNIDYQCILKILLAYVLFGFNEDSIVKTPGIESHTGQYDKYEISDEGRILLNELSGII